MQKKTSKRYFYLASRGFKLFVLLQIVGAIFSGAEIMPTDLIISSAHAQRVPEMPTVMVPVFLAITAVSFYYIRRRALKA